MTENRIAAAAATEQEIVSLKAEAYDTFALIQQMSQRHAVEMAPLNQRVTQINQRISDLSMPAASTNGASATKAIADVPL
jgi:hypothetical protein